jgi:outer membrane protein TolC
MWESTINPVDQPPTGKMEPLDLPGAIRTALDGRTDIVTARENLRSVDINLRFLKNQTLPGLDLTATYTTQGTGGPRLIRDASLGGQVVATIPGGYNQALTTLRNAKFPS